MAQLHKLTACRLEPTLQVHSLLEENNLDLSGHAALILPLQGRFERRLDQAPYYIGKGHRPWKQGSYPVSCVSNTRCTPSPAITEEAIANTTVKLSNFINQIPSANVYT